MPISPENLARYPANWSTEIRPRILERDGNRCKFCGTSNGVVGYWLDLPGEDPPYRFHKLGDSWDAAGLAADAAVDDGERVLRIVLTIAHLHDPDPANVDDANLAALCQRCHNRHDQPMRQANARATRREGKAAGDLFDPVTQYLKTELEQQIEDFVRRHLVDQL